MDLGLDLGLYTVLVTWKGVAALPNNVFKFFSIEDILPTYNLPPENKFCASTTELLMLHLEHHVVVCTSTLCFLGSREE